MAQSKVRRIGILTGGGDCPGLNAVIRGVTKPAQDYGMSVLGILDGFEGLVEGRAKELSNEDVSGILARGGTILGSSNKGDPFHWPVKKDDEIETVPYLNLTVDDPLVEDLNLSKKSEEIVSEKKKKFFWKNLMNLKKKK